MMTKYEFHFDSAEIVDNSIRMLASALKDTDFLQTLMSNCTVPHKLWGFTIFNLHFQKLPDFCNTLLCFTEKKTFDRKYVIVAPSEIGQSIIDLVEIRNSSSTNKFSSDKVMFDAINYAKSSNDIDYFIDAYQEYLIKCEN